MAKDFVDQIERLLHEGIHKGDFKKKDFHVSFATIRAMTFLNGENVLNEDLDSYTTIISEIIYNSLK
ncbi:MAG: hypothetical protein U9N30_03645 [Campylobacterota bacterium]|nr:hypothetical protein [Campylobacterota bacterium]